jgi:hypothetical protein
VARNKKHFLIEEDEGGSLFVNAEAYLLLLMMLAINQDIDPDQSYEILCRVTEEGLDEENAVRFGRMIRSTAPALGKQFN